MLALREEGYAFFDWLTAVDETDARVTTPASTSCATCSTPAQPGALRSVLLRTRAPEGVPVPSLTGVFRGAAWHERETHEMFGIDFDGFDDGTGLGLRPLLLPDGFEGTPLRKSFVLAARASKPWPGAKEPGEGHDSRAERAGPAPRRRPPGVPGPEWGPR